MGQLSYMVSRKLDAIFRQVLLITKAEDRPFATAPSVDVLSINAITRWPRVDGQNAICLTARS